MNHLAAEENNKFPDQEIGEMVKAHGREIFSYCYHLLRNKQDAEDAVQDIFLKAHCQLKKGKIEAISLWLYKVAYHHCLNIMRGRRFKVYIPVDVNRVSEILSPAEELENSEFSDPVQIALDRLSDLQKSILILRAVQGLDYEGIARITHKKPEAVRKNYERAKRKAELYLRTGEGVVCDGRTQNI